MRQSDPAVDRVGITTTRLGDGSWSATMTVTEEDLNRHGVGHGGVLFLLADAVFERVTNADLPQERVAFAAGASIDYVRPAKPGDEVTATGAATDTWGRTTLVDITITNLRDEVVAHFRGQTRTVDRRPEEQ